MKHVTIVVPECDVNINSIGGAHEILTRANAYWQKIGDGPMLDVQIAGFVSELRAQENYLAVRPADIRDIKKSDLVVILRFGLIIVRR